MTIHIHQHWYETPAGRELRQGDIFRRLLVMWFPQDLQVGVPPTGADDRLPVNVEWAVGDWIVLSASCDVDRNAVGYPQAIVCRVLPATAREFGAKTEKEFKQKAEVIRKGLEPSKFLLPEHPEAQPPFPLSFVTYRTHYTMPTDYLRIADGQRLRLRHPFRESFGAWVGANIGRVGPETPTLIPEFPKTYPAHVLKANEE